ncbi:MAG: DUF4199 domain-containing protein [Crocinitomicaceae bacterium]|nr:DUF4199 domain-containing protein [Crocinitomicaceae bacterium]
MKVTFKIAIIFAVTWIALKMTGFLIGWNVPSNTPFFVLSNMFVLLAAISVGLYLQKRKKVEDDTILNDVKNGMATGVVYSMIISAFLYFYYEKIDPDYNRKMIAEREAYFQSIVDDPVQLKQVKENNKDLEIMTKEEMLQEFRKTPQMLFSGGFIMTYGILSMIMLSTFYSIVVAIIYRKVLFR